MSDTQQKRQIDGGGNILEEIQLTETRSKGIEINIVLVG